MNSEREIVDLFVDDIIPNRFQPREIFDEKGLKELSVSIKEHGVIQPIIVRKIGDKYEIIAGERRYKASVMAGLTKIPSIVRNLDDKESSKVALLENLQRRDLSAIEEARTYQKILDLDSMTQEELGATMGKSQAAVANKLRLLTLTDEVQEALLKDQISERHARSLLNIKDKEQQVAMLQKIINNRMTVRELEAELKPSIEIIPDNEESLPKDDFLTNLPVQELELSGNQNIMDLSAFSAIDLETLKSQTADIVQAPKDAANFEQLLKVDIPNESEPSEIKNYKFIPSFDDDKEEQVTNMQPNILETAPAKNILSEPLIIDSSMNLNSKNNNLMPESIEKREPIQINDDIELLEDDRPDSASPQTYQPFANTESLLNEFRQSKPQSPNDINNSNAVITKKIVTLEKNNLVPDLKAIINDIRNMVNDFESKGFVINLDEMDFENSYQINIKIDKSNN